MLDPYGVERPSVKRLRNVFSEEKSGFAPEHEPAEGTAPERPDFEQSGEHIARKSVTWGIHSAKVACICPAKVGIDLIMRGCDIELGIPPESVRWEEHSISRFGLGLCAQGQRDHNQTTASNFHQSPHATIELASTAEKSEFAIVYLAGTYKHDFPDIPKTIIEPEDSPTSWRDVNRQ